MDTTLHARLDTAAAALSEATGTDHHDVAVVLGSGLGSYARRFKDARSVAYAEIPGFPIPGQAAHAGTAHSVSIGGTRTLILAGRVHFYEGFDLDAVCFGVRTAIRHGARTVVLTNAAGGCGDHVGVGDLVAITDHLNLTGQSPLRGPNDDRIGPRYPDLTDTYSSALRRVASDAAASVDVALNSGVYAWFSGPMFETPAEITMAKTLGADLVGMSTVPEAIAARHMGADVIAISLCSNLAAGVSDRPISVQEVLDEGEAAAQRFSRLLDALLPRLGPGASSPTQSARP